MADEAEKTEDKKADAAEGTTLDKLLSAVDGLCSRMDAMEAAAKADADDKDEDDKKADAEDGKDKDEPKEVAADKKADDDDMADSAKKDADDKEDEKAKADAARAQADADMTEMRKKLADMERTLPKQISDADYSAMADHQARADKVFQAFGDSAPSPLRGETLQGYRLRLANNLKQHSDDLKKADLGAIADDTAFTLIEQRVYADALQAAERPADLPPGMLREIVKHDRHTGGRVIEFVGSRQPGGSTFISALKRPGARARILDSRKAN